MIVAGLLLPLSFVDAGGAVRQIHTFTQSAAGTSVHNAQVQSRAEVVPRLGLSWAKWISGFGSIKPTKFTFAIDGYSEVTGIKWASWGGPVATGTGIGWYEPAGVPNADGKSEAVRILAFGL